MATERIEVVRPVDDDACRRCGGALIGEEDGTCDACLWEKVYETNRLIRCSLEGSSTPNA